MMMDDLDLSTVITNDPVNVPLVILEREYTRIRAAAARLREEHPELDELIIAREKHDWRRVDDLLTGRRRQHRA